MEKDIALLIKNYYACWAGLNNLYEEWASFYGLSCDSMFVLYAIWDKDKNTEKQICKDCLMPKQTVNTILKKFEKAGYISLNTLEQDRRNRIVSLTERGKVYANGIINELNKVEAEAMKDMGKENREAMIANDMLFFNLFKEAVQNRVKK